MPRNAVFRREIPRLRRRIFAPSPPISGFTETFTSALDSAIWTPTGTPVVSGGQLNLACTTGYTLITSDTPSGQAGFEWSIQGSSAYVECVQAPLVGNGTTQAYFLIASEYGAGKDGIQISTGASSRLNAEYVNNNAAPTNVGFVTYDPVAHRWWRIRESGGTYYFEAGPDGVTWPTTIGSMSIATSTLKPGAVSVELGCGYWGAETTPRDAIFDNLNNPSGFATLQGSVNLIASPTLTVDATVSTPGGGGAPPAFVRQSLGSSTSSSTSMTITLSGTPAADNLLVFAMAGDKNTGALTLAGWTIETSLLSTSVSLYRAWKVATGSETTVVPSWATASTAGNMAWVGEYSQDGSGAWTLIGSATHTTDETAVNTWSAGTTGTLAQDGLALAFAAIDSSQSITGALSWSNTYANRYDGTGGAGRGSISVGEDTVTSGGTTNSSFTYVGTADQVSGGVLVFGRLGGGPTELFGTVTLTATPTLSIAVQRETFASVSLTATPTISLNGIRTTPATVTLTASPTLSVSAFLNQVASAPLTISPTLSVNAIRTTPATISLSITPTLSISTPSLVEIASVSLIATPTIAVSGVRETLASISLIATPTILLPAGLNEVAFVSLTVTPTLSVDLQRLVLSTVTLPIIPTLSVDALRTILPTVLLTISPTLTATAVVTKPASVSLTATATLAVPAGLNEVASVSLTATPTITVDAVRIVPATVPLTATPTLSVSAQLTAFASLSLIATPTLSIDGIRTAPATLSLIASPTLSVTIFAIRPASLSLSVTPTLTVSAFTTQPLSITLTIIPTGSFLLGGLAGATSLSITPTLTVNAVRTTLPTVSLIASPTLSVNALRVTPATVNLTIATTLSVDAVRITPASVSFTVIPTLSISAFRTQAASVSLIVIPTLSATLVAPGASVALTITPTLAVTPLYTARPTALLTATPTLIVGVGGTSPANVALTVVPTLSLGFYVLVPASISLVVPLVLTVNGVRDRPGSINLIASATLNVSAVTVTLPAIALTILPTLSFIAVRITYASVFLVVTATLYARVLVEGAGPGWPIVFVPVSVTNGNEPVSFTLTPLEPSFDLDSVSSELGSTITVTKPFIDFVEG